ncbi:MAG: bacillithiol biosynthesis cysteine-adding enzyme BshC [Chitinophagaceae bacterium]
MDCNSTALAFSDTGAFSQIAMDYLARAEALRPFYKHAPDKEGILTAIDDRRKFADNRGLLVSVLREQYEGTQVSAAVEKNLQALGASNTFTVTTAHQNNLFTGPLYFIYKILHVVKIAEELNELYPADHFVPVYYMGSEDADLEELNHIYLNGEKLSWKTGQTGAVGRMKVDATLVSLMDLMEGQLSISPEGREIMNLIRSCYTEGETIQRATFRFVNHLLGEFGVVVLIPDHARLKKLMLPVFEDDLLHQNASSTVSKSATALGAHYKVQAHPREINLFYLEEQVRERIEKTAGGWEVKRIGKTFTEPELLEELGSHPERFSPNVILRGLFQETILPNIIFVGGGGELAYWLELKDLFELYKVPMPVLLLRNSFLITGKRQADKIKQLGFSIPEFFKPADDLLNIFVKRETGKDLSITQSLEATSRLYDDLGRQAGLIDPTLAGHVESLKAKTVYRLEQLRKKMLRAEKRKFTDQERQIRSVKQSLFPSGNLQERTESFLTYYTRWGMPFIRQLHRNSPGLNATFVVLECGEGNPGK